MDIEQEKFWKIQSRRKDLTKNKEKIKNTE